MLARFIYIKKPVFLFFIATNNIVASAIKNVAPPNCVITFTIGVILSDIMFFDIKLYPITSNLYISLSNTSSFFIF